MAKADAKATLKINSREGVPDARRLAEVVADPTVTAGLLTSTFSKGVMGETDLTELIVVVRAAASKAAGGDLGELETMLAAQAVRSMPCSASWRGGVRRTWRSISRRPNATSGLP